MPQTTDVRKLSPVRLRGMEEPSSGPSVNVGGVHRNCEPVLPPQGGLQPETTPYRDLLPRLAKPASLLICVP